MSRARRNTCAALMLLTAQVAGAGTPTPSPAEAPTAAPVEEPGTRRYHHSPSGNPGLAPLPPLGAISAVARGGTTRVYEDDEVLTLQASNEEARRVEALMRVFGGRLLRRQSLPALGLVLSTFRLPQGAHLPDRLRDLVDRTPELLADLNHRYHLQQSAPAGDPRDQAYTARLIGWNEALAGCARDRAVGLLDTPVARSHPALLRARIESFSALPAGVVEAPADHATAIASLLVGDPAVARFGGLIPEARLYAAQVFRADDGRAHASAEWLAVGLDWLVAQGVSVINISLGGPDNRVLARAVEEVLARGIIIVAAAGNAGARAPPEYPAAWAPVIAVTAVDAALWPYADANQGHHIDFAAPGVDVWAATASGTGRFYTGTSFAAPFVTAAVAALGAQAEARLAAGARDLGVPGHDPVFGHGMILPHPDDCGG